MEELEIEIPRDRKGEFEPKIIPKYSRDISTIEQQIINLYGMGTTIRNIYRRKRDIKILDDSI